VKRYVEVVNRSMLVDSAPEQSVASEQKTVEEQPKAKQTTTVKHYTIQVMASVNKVSTSHRELKSYQGKVWILEGSGSAKYKYCHGDFAEYASAKQCLKKVKEVFPQAFIITFDKQE
jgi:hypothetical protein